MACARSGPRLLTGVRLQQLLLDARTYHENAHRTHRQRPHARRTSRGDLHLCIYFDLNLAASAFTMFQVREAASVTLTGFLHCGYFTMSDNFLVISPPNVYFFIGR